MSPRRPRRSAVTAAALAAAAVLAACTGRASRQPTPGQSSSTAGTTTTLTVLAGSELSDLEPLLPRIEQATGVRLQLRFTGTLDGAQQVLNGDPADLAWFSSNKYLLLASASKPQVLAQERIMLSPVVLGVKRSVAERFGWANNHDVTWKDVADHAAAGDFRYAMTNPAASNSGFSALVGVASAFAGTGNALQPGDIDTDELRRFFSGQTLTAGSSGFLSDSYVRGESTLDGMINYESILLELNASHRLHEPLDLIYPKDGIITADYPLMLLRSSARARYERVVQFLRTPDIQRWIMTHTDRRPVIPQVAPDSRFPTEVLVELSFPSSLEVVNDLLTGYLNEIRPPAHAVFVLDTSGSMQGPRLASLKAALEGLTGLDQSLTGSFAEFRDREQVTMIAFNDTIRSDRDFTIDGTDPNGPSMTKIRSYVDSLRAGGGTAIYSALVQAYEKALEAQTADPKLFTSVVLLTDGENNQGISADQFLTFLHALRGVASIKTFAVLFGDADPAELHEIADATGGKVFDSRTTSLSEVFKEIRGYQ